MAETDGPGDGGGPTVGEGGGPAVGEGGGQEARDGGPAAGAGEGGSAAGPGDGEGGPEAGDRRAVILVSACLLGVACNHRGGSSPSSPVRHLGKSARLVPVCPEVAGGLPTPRQAAELHPDGRLRTETGEDVTEAYLRGAAHAVDLARAIGATRAVLKARSPSCGCHQVYDGTFSGTLRPGLGITAAALRHAGVEVVSDEDVAAGLAAERSPAAPPLPDAPSMDRPGA